MRGHSPDMERPLGSYAVLMSVYGGLTAGFAAWFKRSGRPLPERMDARDLALITAATHKSARLITKDRVAASVRAPFTTYEGEGGPAEVKESPRGRGLRRVLGELLVCPYCLGMWIATAFAAGLLVAPRLTRQIAAVFTALFGSDLLHIAYAKAEEAL